METALVWNRYMACYDFLNKVDGYVENLEAIAERIPEGAKVLDAGSGTGNLTIKLKQRSCEVVALDFSEAAISEHRRKDPDAHVFKASLEAPLPLASQQFDWVCCASVLFSLSTAGRNLAMAEFRRLLKPGGQLLVSVAAPRQKNSNLLRMHYSNCVKQAGWVKGRLRFVGDLPGLLRILYYNRLLRKFPDNQGYHRLSPDELLNLSNAAGFKNARLSYTYRGRFMLLHAHLSADRSAGCFGAP